MPVNFGIVFGEYLRPYKEPKILDVYQRYWVHVYEITRSELQWFSGVFKIDKRIKERGCFSEGLQKYDKVCTKENIFEWRWKKNLLGFWSSQRLRVAKIYWDKGHYRFDFRPCFWSDAEKQSAPIVWPYVLYHWNSLPNTGCESKDEQIKSKMVKLYKSSADKEKRGQNRGIGGCGQPQPYKGLDWRNMEYGDISPLGSALGLQE